MAFASRPVLFTDIAEDVIRQVKENQVLIPDYSGLLDAAGFRVLMSVNVAAYLRIPNPRPGRFVVVQPVGGGVRTSISEDARVNVECWSDTDGEAQDLAQQVRELVQGMKGKRTDGSVVKRVEITASPAYMPDPESTHSRFRFTANIHRTAKDYQ